jgi:hypothetical protein
MAVLAKKINITNSAGTTQKCNIYGTTGEAGSTYMYVTVDGVQGYVPLVSTSARNASSGRVLKSSTTYAIGLSAQPSYDYRVIARSTPRNYAGASNKLIVASSGTFTVPTGVYRMKVTCVGGGAGGWNYSNFNDDGNCSWSRELPSAFTKSNGTMYYAAQAGGKTTFGSVSAAGATYSVVTYKSISCSSCSRDGCTYYTDYYPTSITASTGSAAGSCSTDSSSSYDGPLGPNVTNISGTVLMNPGSGGNADAQNGTRSSGGSGVLASSFINVTPGQTISYSVGVWGNGWDNGTAVTGEGVKRHKNDSGTSAQAGWGGAILVEWGGTSIV